MLKTYREQSRRAGKDVTLGIADHCARALAISPFELKSSYELQHDHQAGLFSTRKAERRARQALQNSNVYRLSFAVSDAKETTVMLGCPVAENFILLSASTSAQGSTYTTQELSTLGGGHQLLMMLIFAGCVFAEDRKLFFQMNLDCLFCKPTSYSTFLKIFDRQGDVSVKLFSAQTLYCPEIATHVMLTCVDPAPKSKYIIERPDHPHRILCRLRGETTILPQQHFEGEASAGEEALRPIPPLLSTDDETSVRPVPLYPASSSPSTPAGIEQPDGGLAVVAAGDIDHLAPHYAATTPSIPPNTTASSAGAAWLTDPAALAVFEEEQQRQLKLAQQHGDTIKGQQQLPLLPGMDLMVGGDSGGHHNNNDASMLVGPSMKTLADYETPPTQLQVRSDEMVVRSNSIATGSIKIEEKDALPCAVEMTGEVPIFNEAQLNSTFAEPCDA